MFVFWLLAGIFGTVGAVLTVVGGQSDFLQPMRIVGIAFLGTAGLNVVLGLVFRNVARASAQLMRDGLTGSALVRGVSQTHVRINRQPVMRFTLEVQLPGRTPYAVEHRQAVPMLALPLIMPGSVLAVKVDPQRAERMALLFDGTSGAEGAIVGGLHWAGQADAGDIVSRGRPGVGRIAQLVHTGHLHHDGRPIFVLTLDVRVEGKAAYPNRAGYAVPVDKAGLLAIGRELPVRVDPGDPTGVAVVWDEVPA
ncbi:MAG: hypothetical protein U1F43_09145 [Myxococcota bacterium]